MTNCNKYVIEEYNVEPTEEGAHHVVHQPLENRERIHQVEQHDQELKEPFVRPEHCLLDVIGVHVHLVVAGAETKLGEELGPAQLVKQFHDNRNGKFVFNSHGVQGAVVNAKPPRAFTLLDEEHRCGERR
jgi:hypothetical protein